MKKLCLDSDYKLQHVEFYKKYSHLPNYPDYLKERTDYLNAVVNEKLNVEVEKLVSNVKNSLTKKAVKKVVKKKSLKKSED